MKYLLIEVIEREVSEPEFFNTWDAAHTEMCKRVAEAYGLTQEEVCDAYMRGEELDDAYTVLEYEAWGERYGKNFDWKIFEVSC